ASTSCTSTHAITQGDLDAGSITNVATASTTYNGNTVTSNQAQATVTAVKNPLLAITKTATESSFSQVGDVIHYQIQATNTGNVTLTNVTVSDPQVTNLSCQPGNPVASLAPGASITCSASHTIVQADLDAGHFFNQACVDDGAGGATQKCASA